MTRLLITGVGRSGTQYMSRVLTAAGVPCGHEAIFTTDCYGHPDWGDAIAESAWPAVAWLPLEDTRVVHLVRHPMRWLSSWAQTVWAPAKLEGRTTRYLTRHTGIPWRTMAWEDKTNAAMALWVAWNQIASRHADMRVRIEDVDIDAVRAICALPGDLTLPERTRIEGALAEVPTNANARYHGQIAARWCVDKPSFKPFAELAETYGYEIDWERG